MHAAAMTDRRAQQRDQTRDQILQATQELVSEVHAWTVSMGEVADRAGVSRRTIYRYFPTREALLLAASEQWADLPIIEGGSIPGVEALEEYLVEQWERLAAHLPSVLLQHQGEAGREMRRRWLPRARAMAATTLADLGLPEAERAELADLLLAVLSSSMFLELVVLMEHDASRAAELASWAARTILDEATRQGTIG